MRLTVVVIVLVVLGLSQTVSTRVPSTEAEKHLLEKPAPTYPSDAQIAHIQGNVILQITIDESGKVTSTNVVSGHPMLVSAAAENVLRWKYRPFEVNGRPATVTTVAMVTFGKPANQSAESHSEMLFQDNFWMAQDAAQIAVENKDYPTAEQQLAKADEFLGPFKGSERHVREQWICTLAMGELRLAQGKVDQAEEYYTKAIPLHRKDEKDSPELAATFAKLSSLYGEEKKYAAALDYGNRSLGIYQDIFKRAGKDSNARQVYGRIIAVEAGILSRIALQGGDHVAALNTCRTALEFQSFLTATARPASLAACDKAAASASK